MQCAATIFLALVATSAAEEASASSKKKRGLFGHSSGYSSFPLDLGSAYSIGGDYGYGLPIAHGPILPNYGSFFASNLRPSVPYFDSHNFGVSNYLEIPRLNNYNVQFRPVNVALPPLQVNSVEKPVTEPTFEPPAPTQPRPQVSVAVQAANNPYGAVPTGPLALGSGSLGAVQLNGGRYALGSGSIGYSPPRVPQSQPPTPAPPVPLDTANFGFAQYNLAPVQGYLSNNALFTPPPPSYTNDRSAQNFGAGGQPQNPTTLAQANVAPLTQTRIPETYAVQNVRTIPESQGYSSTTGLSGYTSPVFRGF